MKESDHDKAHLCHTAASTQVLSTLLGKDKVAEALELAANLDYRQFIPFMEPMPGMEIMLQSLAESLPLAVATNRGHSMPSILVHFGLDKYFSAVVTSKDVKNPKPAPDMLIEAANRLSLPPGKLLFVGDSELDQSAARAAGVWFANYRGNLQADMNLDCHEELISFFRQNKYSVI